MILWLFTLPKFVRSELAFTNGRRLSAQTVGGKTEFSCSALCLKLTGCSCGGRQCFNLLLGYLEGILQRLHTEITCNTSSGNSAVQKSPRPFSTSLLMRCKLNTSIFALKVTTWVNVTSSYDTFRTWGNEILFLLVRLRASRCRTRCADYSRFEIVTATFHLNKKDIRIFEQELYLGWTPGIHNAHRPAIPGQQASSNRGHKSISRAHVPAEQRMSDNC